MFTGLIEETGVVKRIERGRQSIVLSIEANKVLSDVKAGDSICTNGVCLTVTSHTDKEFSADVANGAYPASEHSVTISDSELEKFTSQLTSSGDK